MQPKKQSPEQHERVTFASPSQRRCYPNLSAAVRRLSLAKNRHIAMIAIAFNYFSEHCHEAMSTVPPISYFWILILVSKKTALRQCSRHH
jgi:hypothetical protein